MYRILIVEDDAQCCEQLAKQISEEIPQSEIVAASTVEGAQQEISYAREIGLRFDAAILDIRLPRSAGLNPVADEMLKELICKLPWGTRIFRISAFEPPSDTDAAESTTDTAAQRMEFVAKTEKSSWSRKIVKGLKRDRIRRQLDELFPSSGRLVNHDSITYPLIGLIRDIESFWSDLEEDDRELIHNYFQVREVGEGVKVSLHGSWSDPNSVDSQNDT